MVIGYHDTHGFDALIPGDASTQTSAVDQAIASERSPGDPGHYEDYSLPLDDGGTGLLADRSEDPPGDEHPDDPSPTSCGRRGAQLEQLLRLELELDVMPALEDYAAYANPDFVSDSEEFAMNDGTLSWAVLTREIDHNRPMVFLVDSDGDGGNRPLRDHRGLRGDADAAVRVPRHVVPGRPGPLVQLPSDGGRAALGRVQGLDVRPRPATVYVDASGGGDFLNIQEGMDASVEGGTVYVRPGTYTGALNRDLTPRGKDITVVSTGGPDDTVIDCQDLGGASTSRGPRRRRAWSTGSRSGTGRVRRAGGVRCYFNCSPTLRNLRIEDCASTGNGGGIFCGVGASPPMSDIAIIGCSATGSGGGISFATTTATVTNVTIYGCSAATGGGIACTGSASLPAIENTIIAGSTSGAGLSCASSANPTTTHSCVYGNAGGDAICGSASENLGVDPRFCDAAGGDLTLRSDSPCIPNGNPWGVTIGAYGAGSCDTRVPDQGAPAVAVLHQPYPNPANSGASLAFELTRAGEVEITVHDAAGRMVRTLASGSRLGAGPHTVAWDGRNDGGRDVANGVYFCSVRCDGEAVTGKLVVVR